MLRVFRRELALALASLTEIHRCAPRCFAAGQLTGELEPDFALLLEDFSHFGLACS